MKALFNLFVVLAITGALGWAVLESQPKPYQDEKGKGKTYHYNAGPNQLKCIDGFAVVLGMVRYQYKVGGEPVRCTVLDATTGRSEFTIPVQTVTVVRAR